MVPREVGTMGKSAWRPYAYSPGGADSWFDVRRRIKPTADLVAHLPAAHGPLREIDERFYLVEARMGWRHLEAHTLPEGQLVYAAADGERVYERVVEAECDHGDWFLSDDVTVHASAVFACSSGEAPSGALGRTTTEVAAEYRQVLADVHGVPTGGDGADATNGGGSA